MDDLLERLKAIRERKDEMFVLLMTMPGNAEPDIVSKLRRLLFQLDDDLYEADALAESASEAQDAEMSCCCGDEFDDGASPLQMAIALADWARQEDPRTVGKALDAIRGGACFRPLPDLLRKGVRC